MIAYTHFVSPNSPIKRLVPLIHADGLELYDLLNARRFRTSIETRGSLLKGVPVTPDRKKDGQLALESFPDNFDISSPLLCSFLCPLVLPCKFRSPQMTSEYSVYPIQVLF